MLGSIRGLGRNLFRRACADAELNDELRSYADLIEEENMSKGMSPEESRARSSAREKEMAVRAPLGAGQGLALAGVAMGLTVAWYLAQYLAPLLYGIDTRDPVTFAIVPVLLAGVTLTASWIPAARATCVDPIETLRHP